MNASLVLIEANVPPRGVLSFGPAEQGDAALNRRKRTVLIVDDETLIADTLTDILNESGLYEALAVYDGASAVRHVQERAPDILITDVVMPGMNGIELAKAVRALHPKTHVVLFSGQAHTRDLVEQARHEGFAFPEEGPGLNEQWGQCRSW